MKVEFINPFVSAAYFVLERFGKTEVSRGDLKLIASPIEGKEVNTVIGVNGDILGQVIYSMSKETALNVASLMMMGMPVTELDEICKSAVNELGNIITGNAATELGNSGFFCNLTPPTLFIGSEIQVSVRDMQVLIIPINSDLGELTIYVALRESP